MPQKPQTTLTVRTQDGRPVVKLYWRDGVVAVECHPALSEEAARWVKDGLDEWIGVGDSAIPRHTPSEAPEFLARLGGYIQRHYGMLTLLEVNDDGVRA